MQIKKYCKAVVLSSALLGSLAVTGSSVAAEGGMIIKPMVTVDWRYDTNYGKGEIVERAVSTYAIRPGLEAGYTTGKMRIELSYVANAEFYHDEDDNRFTALLPVDDDNYVGHTFEFLAESRVTERLSLGLGESFMYTRDPASSDQYSNLTTREKYTINRFSPIMIYSFGKKFSLLNQYTNLVTDHSNDKNILGFPLEDSVENKGLFDFAYQLNRTMSIELAYQVWGKNYDLNTSDYLSNQIMANFSKSYSYFTLTGGLGYHNRNFDKAGLEDMDVVPWTLAISGQSSPDTTEIPKSQMLISLSQNFNDAGTGEQYYTATRVDFSFGTLFVEKLNTFVKGYFQNSDYENSNRDDDTISFSGGVDYLINDYVTLGLEAGYDDRDSNTIGYNYDNSWVMFQLVCNYDLGSK